MVESTVAAKIDGLQSLYLMPEKDRLTSFLSARPGLIDILLEARPHFELQFGQDTLVELRFPRDYECEDFGEELDVRIYSPLDSDPALDRFDRFWDEWLGDASGRPESRPLHFGVEFVGERVQ